MAKEEGRERGWKKEEKKTPAHPCWHVHRLISMAAVSTDVGLRGGEGVRVHVGVLSISARMYAGRRSERARTCVIACDSDLRAI